jgi:hypothetical protein
VHICVQRAEFCACVALHVYERICVLVCVVLSEGVCISVEWATQYLVMCSAELWQQNAMAVVGQLSAVQSSSIVPLQQVGSIATRMAFALFVTFVAGCGNVHIRVCRVWQCVAGCMQ